MKDLVTTPFSGDQIRAAVASDRTVHGATVDAFHRAFYASPVTHGLTSWCGVPILKNPLDLWVYQEILWELQPTVLIETGTAFGGSALFFAMMMDRRRVGRVLSIDIEAASVLPQHPRVTFLRGSSTDPAILQAVAATIQPTDRVMVVLDSDHSTAHVRAELEAYAGLVTPGQFLVVEDTNIDQRPVTYGWMGGTGPGVAVDGWLPGHPEFAPDAMAERFMMTFYPGGWLRRCA